jgi:hypothetical protein
VGPVSRIGELSPGEARELLRLVLQGVDVRARNGGTPVAPWLVDVCRELATVAESEPPAWLRGSGDGTTFGTVVDVATGRFVPTAQAARHAGVSAEYVRRLARTGRIRRRRVGQVWLVDPESLDSVLRRSAA